MLLCTFNIIHINYYYAVLNLTEHKMVNYICGGVFKVLFCFLYTIQFISVKFSKNASMPDIPCSRYFHYFMYEFLKYSFMEDCGAGGNGEVVSGWLNFCVIHIRSEQTYPTNITHITHITTI